MNAWVDLYNFVVEYAGEGTWSITADCIYTFIWDPSVPIANITFTVTRNPDSCFDGYSVIEMSMTPVDNFGWAQAYYDFLTEYYLSNDSDWDSGFITSGLYHTVYEVKSGELQ